MSTAHSPVPAAAPADGSAPGPSGPTVLLAEDHRLVAEGLERVLEGCCRLLATVHSVDELLEAAPRLRPDVLVLDIELQGRDAIAALTELKAAGLASRTVFITMHADPSYLRRALQAGGTGFVLKTAAAAELRAAVHATAEGRTFISGVSPDVLTQVVAGPAPQPAASDPHRLFTPRQRQVLRSLARGLSAKDIGEVLGISQRTVEYHKYQMMQAAGVNTSTALVSWAGRHGLLEAEPGPSR